LLLSVIVEIFHRPSILNDTGDLHYVSRPVYGIGSGPSSVNITADRGAPGGQPAIKGATLEFLLAVLPDFLDFRRRAFAGPRMTSASAPLGGSMELIGLGVALSCAE
jgi:hypothetical protein